MRVSVFARRILAVLAIAAVAPLVAGCGAHRHDDIANPGEQNADRFLYEHGTASLNRKHWLEAREYFRKLVDTYPTSSYRQDAKLGIGDTYLGDRRSDSDVLAANEFREFLRFYPLAAKADYAQYRLAVSQIRQVLAPERDQTATRNALKELETFITNYPQSEWLPEVLKLQRQMRDRLSESEYLVGRHYFRTRWYPGAISRFTELMKTDPQFTGRDGVYFFLAESYYKQHKPADALPLYQKLVAEFRVSEYLKQANARIAELSASDKTQVADAKDAKDKKDAKADPKSQTPPAVPTTAAAKP
jgi:outer membrane protein assembly factor BamD